MGRVLWSYSKFLEVRPLFKKTPTVSNLHFPAAEMDTGCNLLGLAQILTCCTFLHHFSKCRCLKRKGRLFPLEPNQNAYYSVHRSAFCRLLVWFWAEDRENIVYMRMTWTNSNGGISIFLGQRCELVSGQKLKSRCKLIYNCAQIWALEWVWIWAENSLQCPNVSWNDLLCSCYAGLGVLNLIPA